MTEYRDITADDLEWLAVGAWVFGTGGGGSPYLGLLNMRRLYAAGKRVKSMRPEALADDAPAAVVPNQGAPLVGQERLTDSHNIARAVGLMEAFIGKRFRAIMSLEIGAAATPSSRSWPRRIWLVPWLMLTAWDEPIPRDR